MTYRERREARAERLRGWADKREAKAAARFAGASAVADSIPLGQPILVGHHSEGRARRDQDRIHACGFHANPITCSTAIRSAVPRVSDHPLVRPSPR